MAFADDIIVAASTEMGLQQTLNGLVNYLQERGLTLNPRKCITLVLQPNAKTKKTKIMTDVTFRIAGEPIPSLDTWSAWRYLGVSFHTLGVRATPILEELKDYLAKVAKAPLKPQQRLVVLRYYLIPRLYHRLVFEPISGKLLTKMDRAMFFHARNAEGGLGMPSLRTTTPWMRMQRM